MGESAPRGRHSGGNQHHRITYQQALAWANHGAEREWTDAFMSRRGLGRKRAVGLTVGGIAAGIAALIAILGPPGDLRPFGVPVLIAGLVIGTFFVVRAWTYPFSRAAEGVAIALCSDVVIALGCFAHTDPRTGLAASSLLTLVGAFCVFFVNGWTHILHAVIAFATTAILVIMCVQDGVDAREVLPAAIGFVAISSVFLPTIDFHIWLLSANNNDSLIDPLTGLANRRGMGQFVHDIAARGSVRMHTVITIDIDDFKPVNDHLGHAAGDRVLVRIARTLENLTASIGGNSIVARTGGDEFTIITDRDALTARLLAHDVCSAIVTPDDPRVTASLGVATGAVTMARGVPDMMNDADEAMYIAKSRGGNRVEESAHHVGRGRRRQHPTSVTGRPHPSGRAHTTNPPHDRR